MRLIDANALIEQVNRKKSEVAKERYTDGFNDAILRVRSMIHSATTVDAVEVVRCGECKHNDYCCRNVGKDGHRTATDFCSYGERKEIDT